MIRSPPGRGAVALVALLVAVATVPGGTAAVLATPSGSTPGGSGGSATAEAPGGSSVVATAPPANVTTDATRNLGFAGGYRVEVANVTYDDPGEVEDLTVNLTGGSEGNVSAAAVDSVTVCLVNATDGRALDASTVEYRSHGTTLEFDDPDAGADVDRVKVIANVAEGVADGSRIDAEYAFGTATAGGHDTAGVQTARVSDRGYVGGIVIDQFGNPVEGADVDLINRSSGDVVARLTTDEDGEFVPARQSVVPNTSYRAAVTKPGYVGTSYSTYVFVEPGETEVISVTLELRRVADTLRLVRADLGDPNTTADDRLLAEPARLFADDHSATKATFVAIVENSSVEARTVPETISVAEVDVSLGFAEGEAVGDFTDDDRIDKRTTVTTDRLGDVDDDGLVESYAVFEITADGANDSTMYAPAVNVTVEGSFVNALGQRIETTGIEGVEGPAGTTFATDTVDFPDTTTDGESVRVRAATLTADGFVAILDGGAVIGHTDRLSADTHWNLTVDLDEPLSGDATLTARVYEDDGDGRFDRSDDAAGVGDDARVTLEPGSAGGVAVGPNTAPSRDGSPADDGRHQDVDGDGDVDVRDVQVLFVDLTGEDPDAVGHPQFDFNDDGDVDIGDVQALFVRVTRA